jgi:hypothetical protein
VSAQHTPATSRIQRRLERWELEHLRQHAAELAARLEETERRLSYAEDAADSWREEALQMQLEAADAVGGQPGLTMGGSLVIVPSTAGGLQS